KVEHLADRVLSIEKSHDAVHEILDVAPGPDLITVPRHVNVSVVQCVNTKLADGTLADLSWPIYIEWPDHGQRQAVFDAIRKAKMLRRNLAHRIGPAWFPHRTLCRQPFFIRPVDIWAVDLAGGEEDDSRQIRPVLRRRLQHVERAQQVHLHRSDG